MEDLHIHIFLNATEYIHLFSELKLHQYVPGLDSSL